MEGQLSAGLRCVLENLPECRVVLIAPSEKAAVPGIAARLTGRKVLTIADCAGCGEMGVHVNFYIRDGSYVRFEVNYLETQCSGLKVSHLLLQYAKIVNTRELVR